MTIRVLFVLVAAAVAVPRPLAASDVLVEWADHASDPKALVGDPVFMRRLSCRTGESGWCRLMTISVGRMLGDQGGCPLVIDAAEYRTEDSTLKVERRGDDVEIEL